MRTVPSAALLMCTPAFILASWPAGAQNDECASAIALAVGSTCVPVPGHWIGASQSMPADTCGGSASPQAMDVWYAVTATSAITIVEVQSADSNDAVLEAFGGTCGALVELQCADATLFGGVESISLATTIGETYFVRTYWWDYGLVPSDLDHAICAYEGPPPPGNDHCGDAVPGTLSAGSPLTFTGSTQGADTAGDYAPGSALEGSEPSVWHAFTTIECTNVTIAYCATDPAFDHVLSVLATGCPADSLVYAGSFDLLACGDGDATLFFDSLAAGTYYLPVLFDADDANGPYGIEVGATSCLVAIQEASDHGSWHAVADGSAITITGPVLEATTVVHLFQADGRWLMSGQLSPGEGRQHRIDLPATTGPGLLLVRIRTSQGSPVLSVWWD